MQLTFLYMQVDLNQFIIHHYFNTHTFHVSIKVLVHTAEKTYHMK